MRSYELKYKLPFRPFWKKLKDVREDGLTDHGQSRFFILDDNTRIEVPTTAVFVFAPSRASYIEILRAKEESKLKGSSLPAIPTPTIQTGE